MLKTGLTIGYTVLSKAFPSALLYLLINNYGLDKNIISFLLPAAVLMVPILNFGLDFHLTMNGSSNDVQSNNEIMFFLAVVSLLFSLIFFLNIGTSVLFFISLTITLQHSQFYASHLLGIGDYKGLLITTILWRVLVISLLYLNVPLKNVIVLLNILATISLIRCFFTVRNSIATIGKKIIKIVIRNKNFLLNALLAASIFILPRIFSSLQGEGSYEDNILIASFGLSNLLWISFIRRYISQLLNIDFNASLSLDSNQIVRKMLFLIPVFYLLSGLFVVLYCYLFKVQILSIKTELNLMGLMIVMYGYYAILNDRMAREFNGQLQLSGNLFGFFISLLFIGLRFMEIEISDFLIYFFSILGTISYVILGLLRVDTSWSISRLLRPVIFIVIVQFSLNIIFLSFE